MDNNCFILVRNNIKLANDLEKSIFNDLFCEDNVYIYSEKYNKFCELISKRKIQDLTNGVFNFFMKYFENVEDIDWDWVKCDEEVDYEYKGDFSPQYLLEDIKEKLSNK